MRELLHSETARVTFSVTDGTPDSLPTAGCYAGSTLLGAATVNALSGERDYEITYTLPSSGIAPYTVISFRVNAVVNAVALPTTHLVAGELVAARRNTTAPDNTNIGVAATQATAAASQATEANNKAADIQSRIPTALDSGRMITKAEVVSGTVTLATAQPNYAPAKVGDAMTLTSGERTAVANEVEAQIIDETDSEKVLQAIVNKIAAANPDLSGLTLTSIAAAVRTELAVELSRINATISSRASQTSVDVIDDYVDTEISTLLTRVPGALTISNGKVLSKLSSDGMIDSVDAPNWWTAPPSLGDITDEITPVRNDIQNVADLIGEPTGASIAADIAAIDNSGGGDATAENQTEILNKLTQLLNIFKGIDLLRRFLRGG